MRLDPYRICANCQSYKAQDRYHGTCRIKSEVSTEKGVEDIRPLRRRWNSDARNCQDFRGVMP